MYSKILQTILHVFIFGFIMANGKRGLHIFEENADEVTEFLQKKSITASKEGYIIIMPKGSKTCFPIILNVNQIMNIHQDDNIYGDAGHNLLLEARQELKKDIIELDKREQKARDALNERYRLPEYTEPENIYYEPKNYSNNRQTNFNKISRHRRNILNFMMNIINLGFNIKHEAELTDLRNNYNVLHHSFGAFKDTIYAYLISIENSQNLMEKQILRMANASYALFNETRHKLIKDDISAKNKISKDAISMIYSNNKLSKSIVNYDEILEVLKNRETDFNSSVYSVFPELFPELAEVLPDEFDSDLNIIYSTICYPRLHSALDLFPYYATVDDGYFERDLHGKLNRYLYVDLPQYSYAKKGLNGTFLMRGINLLECHNLHAGVQQCDPHAIDSRTFPEATGFQVLYKDIKEFEPFIFKRPFRDAFIISTNANTYKLSNGEQRDIGESHILLLRLKTNLYAEIYNEKIYGISRASFIVTVDQRDTLPIRLQDDYIGHEKLLLEISADGTRIAKSQRERAGIMAQLTDEVNRYNNASFEKRLFVYNLFTFALLIGLIYVGWKFVIVKCYYKIWSNTILPQNSNIKKNKVIETKEAI